MGKDDKKVIKPQMIMYMALEDVGVDVDINMANEVYEGFKAYIDRFTELGYVIDKEGEDD